MGCPPPRRSEETAPPAECVQFASPTTRARGRVRAPASAHSHSYTLTHTDTHTQIRVGGAAARDSESLRESARHAGACNSASAASPRLEPRSARSQPASERPSYLCGGRVRRLRLPLSPTRGSSCRDSRVGVLSGGFCRGATGATSWDAAHRVLGRGKFLRPRSGARSAPPHPTLSQPPPRPARLRLCSALLPARRQSFAPAPALRAAGRA